MKRVLFVAAIVAVACVGVLLYAHWRKHSSGCQVTEFTIAPSGDEAAVYIRIDPDRANLPWTLMATDVNVVTADGRRVATSGVGIASRLAFAFPGLTIKHGTEGKDLSFDLIAEDEQSPLQLQLLPRPVGEAEIAFLFAVDPRIVRRFEIQPIGGRKMNFSLPKAAPAHR